ncbi:hypothetical protein FGE12_22255 [Aggregicoccus sp. 17bor-14]|uniref:hypothetical protein n=1 Tax=Myxococcaceae TaxID=31 RepID=UPI00129D1A4F|nr:MULTISPECIES: hypothetical protein [Myxococcaceae]MBF5045142.1 hypothetical protein [Simulacricoccus sp. 17bor-14]MRI90884.1 hypothetical protein [Aggregicoccus sp. 17bor-14]
MLPRSLYSLALALLLSLVMLAPGGARAQAAGAAKTAAGRCGAQNWTCVALCVDRKCSNECLATGCERTLATLKKCTAQKGCPSDDPNCSEQRCRPLCQKSFEPAPPSPQKEQPDPCASLALKGPPPEDKYVGNWVLQAASLPPRTETDRVASDPDVRADFDLSLEVTPTGCFVLRTPLDDATLGRGNSLEVRAWGIFDTTKRKHHVLLVGRGGQAVGAVCGDRRVIPLNHEKFNVTSYELKMEDGFLILTGETAAKQVFQFEKQKGPESVPR